MENEKKENVTTENVENKETTKTENVEVETKETKKEVETKETTITVEDTLNKQINNLSNEITNLNKTNKTALTKKDNEIEALKNQINEINNNFENEVISQFNINEEQKDFFDYTLQKERSKEENKEKSLKEVISIIKENNNSIFTKNSTPGNIPTASSNSTMTSREFDGLSKEQKFKRLDRLENGDLTIV